MTTSRLKVVLLTIVLNISAVVLFAHLSWSDWRTGLMLNIIDNSILIGYVLLKCDRFLGKLLIFGVALGLMELIADAWLVDVTRTLDYSSGGGPMLWRSPLWMPFAWEVVAVQFAVLGLWLTEKFKRSGLLLTALIGAINIPFYEEMALQTHWWAYDHCRMFLHTPYYIILGEFMIVICIVGLGKGLAEGKIRHPGVAGILGGLGILICYAVAYEVLEKVS
jgi:hypothetical protein